MPIVALQDILKHAYANGYAVASFEVTSLEILEGVLSAAEHCHAPVILSLSERHIADKRYELLMPAVESAAQRSTVPVAIQRHSVTSFDSAVHAINTGCNALMVNALHNNQSNNFSLIRQVINMAHACGVPVESRLINMVDVDEAKAYAQQTGVDFLTVSAEAFYDQQQHAAEIDFQVLQQINMALRLPLVVHADAELGEEQYLRFIAHGVAKIDYGLALNDAIRTHIHNISEYRKGSESTLIANIRKTVSQIAEACMRRCKSMDRSKPLLTNCTAWSPVEHVILYNVSGINTQQMEAMQAEGREMLSSIPGVREVVTACAVKGDAAYRYSWLIRFCHPAVIDSYRVHPTHVAFADKLFRPVASDRISIDYQRIE